MVTPVLIGLQILILGFAAYHAVTALFGWPNPEVPARGTRSQRFRVVVPAHDEGHVLAGLLSGLRAQDHPPTLVTIWVVADRCSDDTAAVAAAAGAAVDERSDGPAGKGAALRWHLDRHPLDPGEALVILDADNRVPRDLLARFADELEAGGEALQAYLDVLNPDASPLATAGAVSYWASNRMVQQARRRLGWPADLGGTGMCLTKDALDRAGGLGSSLTEDTDLSVRLALAGIAVRWMHGTRVLDEKPTSVRATVGQRARWAAGKRATARGHVPALVGAAVARRSLALLDVAIRLVQPGRTMIALVSGIGWLVAWLAAPSWLLPTPVWATATVIQLALPIPFLARDGVPARYLVRYPLLVLLALLWLPIRIVSRLTGGWYHTRHRGVSS